MKAQVSSWLRGLLGPTAHLRALTDGFGYEEGGRYFRMTFDENTGLHDGVVGLLEAWGEGRYHLGWGDWTLAWCRGEFARAFARREEELEVVVKRDVFRLAKAVEFARIDVELTCGFDPDDFQVDLLIRGLHYAGRQAVARLAQEMGGHVLARRTA